jgi:CheY-like chemotaxis protein
LNILVAEDDYLIAAGITEYLEECGFQVFAVGSADQAIVEIETGRPVDLIFSDIQMPGRRDGLDLARWVTANRPDLKMILTSGHVAAFEEAEALCNGGFIPKPYEHRAVAQHIRRHLGVSSPPG